MREKKNGGRGVKRKLLGGRGESQVDLNNSESERVGGNGGRPLRPDRVPVWE